jgi:hypothetical protein
MSGLKYSKLNYLLSHWPNNVVICSEGLSEQHYYKQLLKKYCDSGWLRKVGHGAFAKLGDSIEWPGAIYAIQQELKLPLHVGGLSALELLGLSQNIVIDPEQATLYLFNTTSTKKKLPQWFNQTCKNHAYIQHHLFNKQIAVEPKLVEGITVTVSQPERAILEILDLVPNAFNYTHANDLIENLHLLRPDLVQSLLEECLSFKVKRIFLYLAEKYQLPCFSYLDASKLDLGKGKRVIGQGGNYIPKYQLSVPRLEHEEENTGIGHV